MPSGHRDAAKRGLGGLGPRVSPRLPPAPARPARRVRRDRCFVPRSVVATTDLDAKHRSRRGRADARGHAPHRPGERRPGDRGQAERARDGSRVCVRSTAKVRPIERRGRGVGERRGGAGTRWAGRCQGGAGTRSGRATVRRLRERRAGRRTSGGRISVPQRCDGVGSCDLGVAPRSCDPAFRETFADASRSSDEQCAWEGRGGARRHHLASRVRLTSARRWTWRGHDGVRDLVAGWERRVALC